MKKPKIPFDPNSVPKHSQQLKKISYVHNGVIYDLVLCKITLHKNPLREVGLACYTAWVPLHISNVKFDTRTYFPADTGDVLHEYGLIGTDSIIDQSNLVRFFNIKDIHSKIRDLSPQAAQGASYGPYLETVLK